jgi:succinate-semialdehyde dehydrogenase / glutarate-semialdehyde dehydrogenase
VSGVSLTGSERAGSAVAEVAGRHLKKVILELGGSDPFIVLDRKNLGETVKKAVLGRVQNGGQTCTASKRFIVVEDAYEEFVDRFVEELKNYVPADPEAAETLLGPLSSEAALAGVLEQVHDAVEKGAVLRAGGRRVDREGTFMEAGLLTGVTPQMRAFSEEVFGPVAVVHKVNDAEEAIRLANTSPYGLSGVIFGEDETQARYVADSLESGMVFINAISDTAPDLPFGGTKRSGVGRELGRYGVEEFANRKLVHQAKVATGGT